MSNDFLYGTLGGMFGTFVSHPFDTIRINHQISQEKFISNTIKNIFKNNGYKGLYKGLTAPLFGISLEKSIVFGTFYNLNKMNLLNFSGYKKNLINGFIAGISASLVVTPVEKIKIYLQTNTPLNEIKLNNIYRGFGATFFREAPGYSIYFATYEGLKRKNDTLFDSFWKGCFSGGFCWIFIYPSDIVKTNVQKGGSYKKTIQNIYRTHGFKGFFRGLGLALTRSVPLHGGVFFGYELSKKLLS